MMLTAGVVTFGAVTPIPTSLALNLHNLDSWLRNGRARRANDVNRQCVR